MQENSHILPPILATNLGEIHEICKSHKVKFLWAFGFVLRDDFDSKSDIDLLYELEEALISDEEYLSNYDLFIAAVRKLLSREVDFVHYPSLKNPYFIAEVEGTKTLLYAKEPQKISV